VGGAESVGVRIGLKRLEDGPFLVLASRGVDPDSMFELYRQRTLKPCLGRSSRGASIWRRPI